MAFEKQHLVLDDVQLVLLLPTRCATTSVRHAIQRIYGQEQPYRYVNKPLDQFERPEGYRVVSLIRDPIARMISCYGYWWARRHPHHGIRHFLERRAAQPVQEQNIHIRSITDQVTRRGRIWPAAWLVVETLTDDWAALCRWVGWPVEPLQRENGQRGDLRDVTMQEMYLLAHACAADLVLYHQAEANRVE